MKDFIGKLLYLYARLREPSSQVAFGGAFAILAKYVPAEVSQDALSLISLVFFSLGVFFKEGKPESVIAIPGADGGLHRLPSDAEADSDHP